MEKVFTADDFRRIPHEVREIPNWVNWKLVKRGGKDTKIPIDPSTGRAAKSNDPSTWSTFEKALDRFSEGGVTGLGFCFTEEAGIVGVDLDKCVKDEVVSAEAWAILKSLNTYTEFSQSRTGVHALIRGKLPAGARRRGNVEVYQTGRFFVMTGWRMKQFPKVVIECQSEVEKVHGVVSGEKSERSESPTGAPLDERYNELKDSIVFSSDRHPNMNKVDELRLRSKKFKDTWERKRTDFADGSPSAYCFSLAAQALNNGWSIQEVVDLLICWRDKYNEDLKLDRPDWYLKHTILRAEQNLEVENAATSLEEDGDANREQILKNLTMTTRLHQKDYHILGFYQHGKDNARFSLSVAAEGGVEELRIGSARDLRSVDKLRDLFVAHFRVVIPLGITRGRWENMLVNMMRICELRNPDTDSDIEEVMEWVEKHCTTWTRPYDEDSETGWQVALMSRAPFKKDGLLFVSAPKIREMLSREGNRISQADLTHMLSMAGFVRKKVSAMVEGKMIGTSYWAIGQEKFPWV